jgi:hypothetical protein
LKRAQDAIFIDRLNGITHGCYSLVVPISRRSGFTTHLEFCESFEV